MAQLPTAFDPSQVAPSTGPTTQLPVSPPEGWLMMILSDELVETKSKDGHNLEMKVRILEGEMQGFEGVDRFSIMNPNETTMRIAYQDLSALAHAVGVTNPTQDTTLYHGKPFRAVVAVQVRKGVVSEKGYTEITKYMPATGAAPAAPAVAGPTVAAPVAPPIAAPPAPAPVAPAPVATGAPTAPPPVAPVAVAPVQTTVAPPVPVAPVPAPVPVAAPVAPVAAVPAVPPVAPPTAVVPVAPVAPAVPPVPGAAPPWQG